MSEQTTEEAVVEEEEEDEVEVGVEDADAEHHLVM